ncbi:MAG: outer membrane lipoprotein carrier protein LolA [Syntrophobacteraceae bacterium]
MTDSTNHAAVKTGPCRSAFPCLLLLLLFLCSTGPVSGAGPPRMLGEILSKTEANYQNIHAFTAIFQQKTTSAAAGTLSAVEARGRLYYAKPRQMRWEYDTPEEQVFVANNQFAWLYVRAENQITLFDADKLFASPLARTFFEGALGLKTYFDVTLDPIQSTQNLAVLKLVPKQEDPSVKLLYLWIDLRSYRISRIQSLDIVGNSNEIAIDSFMPHSSLDPGLFHLEAPPSAKVFGADGREMSAAEIEQLKARISSGK